MRIRHTGMITYLIVQLVFTIKIVHSSYADAESLLRTPFIVVFGRLDDLTASVSGAFSNLDRRRV